MCKNLAKKAAYFLCQLGAVFHRIAAARAYFDSYFGKICFCARKTRSTFVAPDFREKITRSLLSVMCEVTPESPTALFTRIDAIDQAKGNAASSSLTRKSMPAV